MRAGADCSVVLLLLVFACTATALQSPIPQQEYPEGPKMGSFGVLMYGLWLQVVVAPAPQAGWSKGVDKIFGKWIFLTSQSLLIVAVYFGVNVAHEAALLAGRPIYRLERLAHWLAPVSGGFGAFLTVCLSPSASAERNRRVAVAGIHDYWGPGRKVMFYLLVWSSENFQRDTVKFWHDKGLPFAYWQHAIHAPAAILILADARLKRSPPIRAHVDKIQAYIPLFAAYGTFYISLIRYNHAQTSRWPYPFLGQFSAEWQHWAFYAFAFGSIFAMGRTIHNPIL